MTTDGKASASDADEPEFDPEVEQVDKEKAASGDAAAAALTTPEVPSTRLTKLNTTASRWVRKAGQVPKFDLTDVEVKDLIDELILLLR